MSCLNFQTTREPGDHQISRSKTQVCWGLLGPGSNLTHISVHTSPTLCSHLFHTFLKPHPHHSHTLFRPHPPLIHTSLKPHSHLFTSNSWTQTDRATHRGHRNRLVNRFLQCLQEIGLFFKDIGQLWMLAAVVSDNGVLVGTALMADVARVDDP